jgi:hypothetical protein
MIAPDAQGHKLFQSSIAGEWTIVDGRAVYAPAHGSSAQAGRVELSFLGPKIVFAEYGLAVILGGARKEAEKSGLDPNKWFNNLELVVAEQIGDRDHDLCAQHLQILCRVQAYGRRAAGS